MEFSRPRYWSGKPFPSLGDLPNPGIKPRSSTLQVDSYQLSHKGSLRILEWEAYPFSSRSSWPRDQTRSPALQADSLPTELWGKPENKYGMEEMSPAPLFSMPWPTARSQGDLLTDSPCKLIQSMLNQGCFSQMWYGLREVMEPLVQSIGGEWKWKAWKQLRGASQVVLVVKILPASAGDAGDMGSVPGWGRSGGGHGNPLWYSCLGNPMDRGAWRATVHRVTKSQARLKQLSTYTHGESGSGKFLPKTDKGCLCSSASCTK